MDVSSELPDEARSGARLGAWLALIGALSLLNLIGNTESGPPEDFVYLWSSAVFGLIQFAIMLVIVLAIAGTRRTREMLALRRPASWWRALGVGAGLIVAVYIFVAVLSPLLQPGEEQGLTPSGWDSSRAAQFAANFVVIAVFVPIVEELLFRGLGVTLLLRFGPLAAIVLVGVCFSLVHGVLEALPVLALFGGGLAYIRVRYASVFPCVVIHGSFNALSLVLAVLI